MKKSQVVQAVKPDVIGWVQGVLKYPITTQEQITTPTTPDAGQRVLYARNDGFYQLTSAGVASRLALASEIPTLTYPKRFAVMGDEITTAVANWAFTAVASMQYGGSWVAPTANAANGDEYTFSAWLAAGNYTVYHLGRKGTAQGIVDWYLDGSAIAAGANRDWYAAAGATFTDSFAVTLTAGYHVFKLKVDGKHASSTDYVVSITKIWLKLAAD